MKRFALLVATLATQVAALAQTPASPPSLEEPVKALQGAVGAAQSAGDNAWILTSCALVLMMTGPGLALFYGGLVRKKNILGTMMQSFVLMIIGTIMWALIGYSLSFGEGNSFIGDLRYALMAGVGADPRTDYAATIPHLTWMAFQMMVQSI